MLLNGLMAALFVVGLMFGFFGWFRFSVKTVVVGLLIVLILMVVLAFVASAAENSAPIKNPVAAEKSACSTEFNIDDSSWALRLVEIIPIDAVSNDLAVNIAPDATYLYLAHTRFFTKMGNSNCVATLFSYGELDGVDGKRVWGRSSFGKNGKKTFFLLLDNDSPVDPKTFLKNKPDVWKSGDDLDIAGTCDGAMRCRIAFTLYKEKLPIASRVLDIVALRVLDIDK